MKKKKRMYRPRGTDLTFIQNLVTFRFRRGGYWNLETFTKVVELLKAGADKDEVAKQMGKNRGAINAAISELRQAGENGYTLEKYLEAGRPYRPGAKEIE